MCFRYISRNFFRYITSTKVFSHTASPRQQVNKPEFLEPSAARTIKITASREKSSTDRPAVTGTADLICQSYNRTPKYFIPRERTKTHER